MLPGYNHNIRYKDKLFHVQTEDNGLDDPALVTQVFLGGQIVAIERSSYGDVLVDGLDEKARDDRIRFLMQDQHKRLLKHLVHGTYDAKIESFMRAEQARPVQIPDTPTPILPMPEPRAHEPDFDALDAAILDAAQNPITPESLLAPDAVLEQLSTNILFPSNPLDSAPPVLPPPSISSSGRSLAKTTPQPFRVEDLKNALKKPESRSDSDRFDNNDDAMLGMIEQHMHQQLLDLEPRPVVSIGDTQPGDPSTAQTLEEPMAESSVAHIQRARELAKNADSAVPRQRDQFVDHIDTKKIPVDPLEENPFEAQTKLARRKPSNARGELRRELLAPDAPVKQPDTLVDYGLPAALRREIDEEIARRQATPPPEVAKRSSSQSDGRVAVFRNTPQKPEGRYSSVRKAPVDRPFDAAATPIDPNLEKKQKRIAAERFPSASRAEQQSPDTLIDVDRNKLEAEAARVRGAGARRVSRPPAPDPKTGAPAAPRKIVEKQAPQAQQPEKAPPEDPKRPSILVVERSLDEVILSYLYDEMAEK